MTQRFNSFATALRRAFALLALAVLALFAAPQAALAAAGDYPAGGTAGTVSSGTVEPGESVVFSGTGFTPNEDVRITVNGEATITPAMAQLSSRITVYPALYRAAAAQPTSSSTVQADGTGSFTANVTLQNAGTFTLVATGLTSAHSVRSVVRVAAATATAAPTPAATTPSTDAGGGSLSVTGVNGLATMLWSGLTAVAIGAGLLLFVRLRRRADRPQSA